MAAADELGRKWPWLTVSWHAASGQSVHQKLLGQSWKLPAEASPASISSLPVNAKATLGDMRIRDMHIKEI